VIAILSTTHWMLRWHPYEYLYFSIPAHIAEKNFERDYRGLSYRTGFEWILAQDERERITVHPTARIGQAGADTLSLSKWNRLYFETAKKR
jgi:hypothetical protein